MLQILDVVDQPIDLFVEPPQVDENEIVGFAAHPAALMAFQENGFKPPSHRDRVSGLGQDGGRRVSEPAATAAPDWRDGVFAALQAAAIRQVGYVPDAGHARLIELCRADTEIRAVPLTSEEEGIGLAAGAWLGGQRAALLMQSSGVGNCINLLSLAKNCRFPMLLLVTMRGERAEFNPWQVPMGTATQAALELMDVLVYRVERPEDAVETVTASLEIAFGGDLVAAVLLPAAPRRQAVGEMIANERRLDRRAAIRILLENRDELLLVTGLGSTSWDAASVGDDNRNFYLWGAMGAAAVVGRPGNRPAAAAGWSSPATARC